MPLLAFALGAALGQMRPAVLPTYLDDVSKRAFQYFWDQSNPTTGLTKDRAGDFTADNYTVASAAATGCALAAYSIGASRGWMPKATLQARVQTTLNFLNTKGSKYHGWFYHFVDWSTGARVWSSEVSSIDTSILLGGILMAQVEFSNSPTIVSLCKSIEGAVDWNWMLTNGGALPTSLTYCMGWTPESGFLPYRWNHYNENMMLYIQGLGLDANIPASTWTAFSRDTVTYKGVTLLFGGPLFIHQESQGFLDFTMKRDVLGYDYWVASKLASQTNRQYCIDNPNHYAGYATALWGLSACDTPTGYGADGAPGNIVDDGTLAPSSAVASVPYTPDESIQACSSFKAHLPAAFGRYGFVNGENQTKKWIDTDVIGIDLGWLLLGIENYRDGLPHALSMANPVNARGMARAGFHVTNEGAIGTRVLYKAPTP